MSSDVAVRVEGLAKRYRIGQREPYRALRDTIADAMNAPFRIISAGRDRIADPPPTGFIWALKDVSFEVAPGEIVGIIGRNGAGKSTLLKVLSRITEPTEGYAELCGRVSSLLEVGTGFHSELTGRENVYLNGAILGMTRSEIGRKFDEIIDFSGVEDFVDTPVKHYSSGMQMRLAFAVAAHLEPEILIIDEVLAVGDAEFQRKCLGKMKSVAGGGRTVLFVSHNMAAVRNLCERAILLDAGRLVLSAGANEVVSHYLAERTVDRAVVSAEELEKRTAGVIDRHNPSIRLRQIAILNQSGVSRQSFDSDEEITVAVAFECFSQVHDLRVIIYVVDDSGAPLLATQSHDDPLIVANYQKIGPGLYNASCTFPRDTFGARRFFLDVHLQYPKREHLVVEKIVGFEVQAKMRTTLVYGNPMNVYFRPLLNWRIERLDDKAVENYADR